jgi:WD40 repeat protein
MKDYVEEQNQDINTKDFELSHIIGLNTNIEKSIQAHPTMMDTIIYSVGGIIVVEDLNDRNNQVFFRHGRNQIGSFRISNNGQFLAVGFISDNLEKRIPTSVILWNFETKEVIYELTGIFKGVSVLEFSQDDQYLSGGGLDNSIFIWQIQTGYKCFHKVFEFNINLLQWTYIFMDKNSQNTIQNQNQIQGKTNTNPNTPQDPNIKKNINNINNNQKQSNTEYYLTIANVNVIHYLKFYYDFSTSQFFTNFSRFNLPSTGYNRIYSSSLCDLDNRVLYLGTSGGELSSFALDNLSFKESFNVINNGVTALLYMENMRSIIISGGDSRIKKMIFNEGKKILSHEIKLSGRVIALTKGPDEREFFAATKNGEIFRILVEDFTYTLHSISHVTPVNSCDFFRGRNDVCFISDETVINFLF